MIREAQLSTDLDDGVLERTVRALEHAKLNFPPVSRSNTRMRITRR